MQDYPFKDFYHVIEFVNSCNPARHKSINLIERENKQTTEDPSVLWSLVLCTMTYGLRVFPHYKAEIFRARYFAPRDGDASQCLSIEDIQLKFQLSRRTVFRWLAEITEELERIFIDRRIIPPNEDRAKRPE